MPLRSVALPLLLAAAVCSSLAVASAQGCGDMKGVCGYEAAQLGPGSQQKLDRQEVASCAAGAACVR